mgnify:FL=1
MRMEKACCFSAGANSKRCIALALAESADSGKRDESPLNLALVFFDIWLVLATIANPRLIRVLNTDLLNWLLL